MQAFFFHSALELIEFNNFFSWNLSGSCHFGCSHIDCHLFAESILTVAGGIDRNISNVDSGLGIRSILMWSIDLMLPPHCSGVDSVLLFHRWRDSSLQTQVLSHHAAHFGPPPLLGCVAPRSCDSMTVKEWRVQPVQSDHGREKRKHSLDLV